MTPDSGAGSPLCRRRHHVYEQAARRGRTVIAVYAPEEAAQRRAYHLLRQHFADHIKYYGRFAITDLSRR